MVMMIAMVMIVDVTVLVGVVGGGVMVCGVVFLLGLADDVGSQVAFFKCSSVPPGSGYYWVYQFRSSQV